MKELKKVVLLATGMWNPNSSDFVDKNKIYVEILAPCVLWIYGELLARLHIVFDCDLLEGLQFDSPWNVWYFIPYRNV